MRSSHFISPRLQDAKMDSLQTQQDYLNLLRLRHLHWMSSAETPGIESTHMEIAGLIEQITAHYSRLRAALQQARDSE